MKTVLEIPVFATHSHLFENFSGGSKDFKKTKYHDFLLIENQLNVSHSIYFYCMDYIPEAGNISLVDQIIPKAPFSLFYFDNNNELNSSSGIFADYTAKYTTPAFIVQNKGSMTDNGELKSDTTIDLKGFDLILPDQDSHYTTNNILVEAIKRVSPDHL